jgi:hypothetical protein
VDRLDAEIVERLDGRIVVVAASLAKFWILSTRPGTHDPLLEKTGHDPHKAMVAAQFRLLKTKTAPARDAAESPQRPQLLKSGKPATRVSLAMLAMNYRGPMRVRIDEKPMPEILHPQDAIVRVTRSCICGSDLHLYQRVGAGYAAGHDVRSRVHRDRGAERPEVQKLKVGDHVLVPFQHRVRTLRLLSAGALRQLPRIETRRRRQWAASSVTHTRRAATRAGRRVCAVPVCRVGRR